MRTDTLAAQLLYSTVRIEAHAAGRSSTGTGFVYIHEWDELKGLFLVTNKHVVEGFERGSFFFTRLEGDKPRIGDRFDVQIDAFDSHWIGHPDPEIDITVMPLTPVLNEIEDRGEQLYYRGISRSILPNEQQLEQLGILEEVAFIGYPNGLFDQVNLIPVVRRGMTATPLQLDYEGKPVFLIDASVFPGSSGSPVFILNEGSYFQGNSLVVGGQRVLFLGVVAAVMTSDLIGTIEYQALPSSYVAVPKIQSMIDLGIVYKASTVVETIEHCVRQYSNRPRN